MVRTHGKDIRQWNFKVKYWTMGQEDVEYQRKKWIHQE
jgi:hypothetical protein